MAWYADHVALADFINRNSNLDITVVTPGGSQILPDVIEAGQADLAGTMGASFVAQAYQGVKTYDKPHKSVRLAINLARTPYDFWTVPRTGIKSIEDFRGKRVPNYTGVPMTFWTAVLEAHGISWPDDVKAVPLENPGVGCKELGLGRVDVAMGTIEGSKIIELADVADGVVAIPIEPDKFALGKAKDPLTFLGISSGLLNPGDSTGVINEEPVPIMTSAFSMMASKDTDEEAIYTFVKVILDRAPEIVELGSSIKSYRIENAAVPGLGVPYHPGAVRAFKEKGLWTDELERDQQEALKS